MLPRKCSRCSHRGQAVRSKLYDIEMSLCGILRGQGLKVGPTTSRSFAGRINYLVAGQPNLEMVAGALLSVHAAALHAFKGLEKKCGRSAVPISGFGC